MRFTYDKEADALAIELKLDGRSASTKHVGRDVRVDFDKAGHLVGVEVLNASEHIPRTELEAAESPVEWLSLAEAEKRSGLTVSTLRSQIVNGKLKGSKQGRDWAVAWHDLVNYLENRAPSGKPARRRKARRPATAADKAAST